MNAKDFLTILLDTPMSNKTLSHFLLSNYAPTQDASLSLELSAKKYWGHLARDWSAEWPVVCKNCRTVQGWVTSELLVDQCGNCQASDRITEASKAVDRLLLIFRDAGIKSIAPILMHLAENPLPFSSERILKNKNLVAKK